MKFIFVGDPHWSSRGPQTRLDDYVQVIYDKLEQIKNYALNNGISKIIFAGDLLTTSDNSTEFINGLINYFYGWQPLGLEPCSIIGNHDSSYTTYENFKKRQCGTIIASGAIKELVWDPDLGMLGVSAYNNIPEVEDPYQVLYLVVHHFLCKTGSDVLYFLPSELKQQFPNLKAIFAGHDHCYYGTQVLGGVTTVRPGSLIRQNSNRLENDRTPCFAVYNTEDHSVDYIPLNCKPFNEVFDTSLKDLTKENGKELESFLDSFTRVRSTSVDTSSFVQEVFSEVVANDSDDLEFVEFLRQDIVDTGFVVN